jgi:hypothetical protein
LGLFPVTQQSGIRQTSAESTALLFPSLAQRAAGDAHLPWRDSAWLMRLFTELTFSHLLELSRIDELSRRAFYELYRLKERWSVRDLQRQRDSLLFERGRVSAGTRRTATLYVNYLGEHVAQPDENPPVGILLCAERDAEVVRFATANADDVFVTVIS